MHSARTYALGVALIAFVALRGALVAQSDLPNPYREEPGWAKLGAGRHIGNLSGLTMDRDGQSVWMFDRCGGSTCQNSNIDPFTRFDASGRVLTTFGAKLFNRPHGVHVDSDGNVWATDDTGTPPQDGTPGRGHTVMKFSPEGRLLMTLGTPGVPGEDATHFNRPTDVIVARNGDILVADGHGGTGGGRIVKFDKTGKFLMAWGKHGTAPGEFANPHGLALDSQERLFVADHENNRIQIFTLDGTFVAEWKQFGRPAGIAIDENDMLYVADPQSDLLNPQTKQPYNPGFTQGIRIGSVKDGKLIAYIPEKPSGEGVAVDDAGNVYVGHHGDLKKYVRQR